MTIPTSELCDRYRRICVSVVCDALYELGLPERVLPSALKPLLPDVRMAGIAYTLVGRAIRPGVGWGRGLERIKSYLEMFQELRPDSVLVSHNPDSEVGHFGELTGNSAQQYGCAGVVLDGNLRDLDGLLDIGLQVFYRDLSPLNAIGRWEMTASQVPVTIGDVTVEPGDLIVGDRDGVLVVAGQEAERVLERSESIVGSEKLVRADMRAGATPWEGLERHGHI
ncbi:MAG: RraA family protein [Acidimicrobiaceae bacterium]|nr:RraA family protein [Acidimicrobiaceae bacterium]